MPAGNDDVGRSATTLVRGDALRELGLRTDGRAVGVDVRAPLVVNFAGRATAGCEIAVTVDDWDVGCLVPGDTREVPAATAVWSHCQDGREAGSATRSAASGR